MKKLSLFVIAFLFSATSFAQVTIKLPVPQLETLPNGLQIAWFLSDSLPVIDLALLVKSGFRDDPIGKTGTAELLAQSLDRGAGGMTAQDIAQQIESLGASRYFSAEEDTFSLGMHGLAPDAPVLLGLMAKLALKPDFPEAEVKREHARLLDRWTHIGDYAESLAGIAYRRILSSGTSYGRGNFYSVAEFKKVSREDVLEFHKKHFKPKNAILMVVGRVDQKKFREQIVETFGGWTGEAPLRDWKNFHDQRLPRKKGEIIVVHRPGLTQAQVRIGMRAPLIQAPEHYSLSVANAMLGEYFNSRLNSLVRDKLGLTYGIGSGFSYSKDFASFTISSATRNEAVGQLVKKSIEVVREMKRGPIPAAETQMAKEYLVGGFPLSTSTLGAVAARWLGGYIFELGPDYLNEFVPKVEKVSSADISAALGKYFDLDQLVIVVAGDAPAIEKSLAAAGFHQVRRFSEKDLQ